MKDIVVTLIKYGVVVLVVLFLMSIIPIWDFSFNPFRQPTSTVNSSQTVLQGIKSMGELVSVSAQVAKADIGVNIRWGVMDICNVDAHYVSQATIKAGINLNDFTDDNVVFDEATDTFILTLPGAQLTDCILDPIATRQYDTRGANMFCPMDWDKARRLASYVAINEFRDDVLEGGLLDQAERYSEIVLANFVKALTQKEVRINFTPQAQRLPPSCAPRVPDGWVFDEELKRWKED